MKVRDLVNSLKINKLTNIPRVFSWKAYCVKLQAKREIVSPKQVLMPSVLHLPRKVRVFAGHRYTGIGALLLTKDDPPVRDPMAGRKGKLVYVESPAKARTVGRFFG